MHAEICLFLSCHAHVNYFNTSRHSGDDNYVEETRAIFSYADKI